MATGGSDRSVDSRVVCSVCLEPYRGRQPKLLPCFHTFCLPCLSQLAESGTRPQTSGDARPATDEVKEKTATFSPTIACPTCRNIIPVPPGGVQHFQAVLARLDEEEGEITRQRSAMDHDIQTRYAAGLRHMADARDQCLSSLRDAAQAAQDKLEVERTLAKMTHSSLSPLMDSEQTSPHPRSFHTAQASLLNDATLRHFQQISQKKVEPKSYFSYCPSDSVTPSLTDSLGRFMGTVVPFGQASDLTDRVNNKPLEDVDVDYKELLTNANLRHDVTAIQADFARLQQKVQAESETLKQEMAALQADNAKVHQELTTMGAENVRLLKDVRSQQADAARLNTDTADLKQDVAYLKAENKKNGTDFDTLKKDVGSLTQDLAALLDKVTEAQKNNSALQVEVTSSQGEIASLQQALVTVQDSVGN
ncbi:hypothetical protein BaRGS_00012591, partial [Batillaria attramentaria]